MVPPLVVVVLAYALVTPRPVMASLHVALCALIAHQTAAIAREARP